MVEQFVLTAQVFPLTPTELEAGRRIARTHDEMMRIGWHDPVGQTFMPQNLSVRGGFTLDVPCIRRMLAEALLTSAYLVSPIHYDGWRNRVVRPRFLDLDTLLNYENPHFRRICAVSRRIGAYPLH